MMFTMMFNMKDPVDGLWPFHVPSRPLIAARVTLTRPRRSPPVAARAPGRAAQKRSVSRAAQHGTELQGIEARERIVRGA